jgi:hypothetical protein
MGGGAYSDPSLGTGDPIGAATVGLGLMARMCNIPNEIQPAIPPGGLFGPDCPVPWGQFPGYIPPDDWTSPGPDYPSWWGTGPGPRIEGPKWEMMGLPGVGGWWGPGGGVATAPPPPDFTIDPNDPLNRRPVYRRGHFPSSSASTRSRSSGRSGSDGRRGDPRCQMMTANNTSYEEWQSYQKGGSNWGRE